MFDPHADPHGKGLVRNQRNKRVPPASSFGAKWPESVENQGMEGSQPVGKDEVGGSNPPSSSTKRPLFD